MHELIASIGKKLNIPQTDDIEWACQIVYSVAGLMALASLWDQDEDVDSISIQHFKQRISQIVAAYTSVYPPLSFMISEDTSDLEKEIYSLYLRSGHLYHSSHHISPSVTRSAGYSNITLHRGASLDDSFFMSGLGFYSLKEALPDVAIAPIFGLQTQSFESHLDELLSQSQWEPVQWPETSEFLRLDPPFSKGYWQKQPNKDQRISLARYGEPNKILVFYRWYDGIYQQKTIPEWRLRDGILDGSDEYGEYRRIAIALLMKYGTLPDIVTSMKKDIVEIKLGYRLPPSEEVFFQLYSWPVHYDFSSSPQVFKRKMAKTVYPMFKHELELLGYRFVEE